VSEAEWARCAPWLKPALDRADEGLSLEDVRRMVETGRAGLLPGQKSAAVIRVQKVFHTWLAGGDLSELLHMEEIATGWARDQGCERMTLIGRKGWARVLASRGYVRDELLVKDL
jgi:hypothetical protein